MSISRVLSLAAVVLLIVSGSEADTARRRVATRPIPFVEKPAVHYRGNAQRTGVTASFGPRSTPSVVWRKELRDPLFGPLLVDGLLIQPTIPGRLVALDVASGEERWAFTLQGVTSATAIQDGVVFVGGGANRLYALDARSGAEVWSFVADSSVWSGSPLLVGDLVYVGSDRGTVYAIDRRSGQERWRFSTGSNVLFHGAAAGDTVYFAARELLVALDATTGVERWRKRLNAEWLPFVVVGDVIYAGVAGNVFLAIDARNGNQLWRFADRATQRADWNAPVVHDGVVYAGNRTGTMYAFSAATGQVIWRATLEDRPEDAVLADGVLYFGMTGHSSAGPTTERSFYALDAATGAELWRIRERGLLLYGEPLVRDGTLYFAVAGGSMIALR